MKRWVAIIVVFLGVGTAFLWYAIQRQGEVRRACVGCLRQLSETLEGGEPSRLLSLVALPEVVRGRSPAEQAEFLSKALREEVSLEGVRVLEREGWFGSSAELFPEEAEAWARQGGVETSDCVAFRMEKENLRCEVVLAKVIPSDEESSSGGVSYRILRVNNVRQMAEAGHSNKEKEP
jgi:hypothetical protein